MESLLPLLLFIVFIALRALSNRARPQPREEGGAAHDLPAENAEMDEALRQIREALGMPTPTPPSPRPVPRASPAPPPPLPPPAPSKLRPRPAPEFRERRSILAEDAFEQRRDTFVPPHNAPHLGRKDNPKTPLAPLPPATGKRVDTEGLGTPEAARQAFVVGEIFGPPRARQRPGKQRPSGR